MRSISSSICCSDEEGELRRAYVASGGGGAGEAAGAVDVDAVAFTGGSREKRDGDGEINERYWSSTRADHVPALKTCSLDCKR